MSPNPVHRRNALKLFGAAAILPIARNETWAQPPTAGRVVILSDLHSAYARLGPLLAALENDISDHDAPHAILVNGDVFEIGNVVATRSGGAIDWTFLSELAKRAPTVLNIGNHEPDLVADLAAVVARAREAGLTVVSNIVDRRTGEAYADASTSLDLGDLTLTLVGIATNALGTYPAAAREMLDIPDPVAWARENLPQLFVEGSLPIVLSHAGVVADRAILPTLPRGTLLLGGHDHLMFQHAQLGVRYVHTGSWASAYSVASVAPDGAMAIERKDIAAALPSSARIAPIIAATLTAHLTDTETAVIGHSSEALKLGETGRAVSKMMADAAGADVGFLNHTTLGSGLPRGDISRYQLDAVLRFDGKLMAAEIDAAALAALTARVNQDGDMPLSERTGDFLYAAPRAAEKRGVYRIVANDWAAGNQMAYFGREDIAFTELPGLTLKSLAARSLAL